MSYKICNQLVIRLTKNFQPNFSCRYLTSDQNSIKKFNEKENKPSLSKILIDNENKKEKSSRKGPFKFYFDDEERELEKGTH